jgi:8-oxo-dGTP pyrophosphatase MutT (NUDIX family)
MTQPPILTMTNSVAALILDEGGRYLLQLRDDLPEIWFPDHWGLFGGAIDGNEALDEALTREMEEELGFVPEGAAYFTRFDYDASFFGRPGDVLTRHYYVVHAPPEAVDNFRLGEGQRFQFFEPRAILDGLQIAPYDSFILWLHISQDRVVYGNPVPAD